MTTIKADFEKRVSEIELYFRLLNIFAERNGFVRTPNSKRKIVIDPELLKIMKANSFLLLYNLIESSISQSLTHIYDTISAKGVTYSQVKSHLKKIWIKHKHKNFIQKGSDAIFSVLESIDKEVLNIQGFDGIPFSGSIDGLKIREIADFFGFSHQVHYTAGKGEKLNIVKNRRNKLAHGEESFSECGRSYTYAELLIIKNQVIRYLRQTLKNIEHFLNTEQYIA